MKNTFKKRERLTKKCIFDALFAKGKTMKFYPIRAIYLEFSPQNFEKCQQQSEFTQVAFSVPKRRFKKAVDRNRIKRQMREAYRLNKTILNENYAIVFVYLPHDKLDYKTIEVAMINTLKQINQVNSKK